MDDILKFVSDELSKLSERIKKYKKKERSDEEIVIEILRYGRHRFLKHPESGIHFCLTKDEGKRLVKVIEELELTKEVKYY